MGLNVALEHLVITYAGLKRAKNRHKISKNCNLKHLGYFNGCFKGTSGRKTQCL